MTAHIRTDARANLAGSAWMIAAMAGFAFEDALLKSATAAVPIWQVMILFGAGGALVFGCAAGWRRARLLHTDVLSRPMKIRVLFEVLGRLFYVLAIALTPLSSATVILQATPLVVVAGAALFFNETVGWRRWSAIFVGLVGVVVIIQPTGDSFTALSLLAVLGMIGFAGRDLASRAAPATLGTAVLGFYGFLSILAAGIAYRFWEEAPDGFPDRPCVDARHRRDRHGGTGLCRADEGNAHWRGFSRYAVPLLPTVVRGGIGRVHVWRRAGSVHVDWQRPDRCIGPVHPVARSQDLTLVVEKVVNLLRQPGRDPFDRF